MNLQYRGRPVPELGVGAFPARPVEIRELARRPAPPVRRAVASPLRLAHERVIARAWRPAWGARPVGFGAARWRPEWGNRPQWFGARQWRREWGAQPVWWIEHLITMQSDPPDDSPDDSQSTAPAAAGTAPTSAAATAPSDGSAPPTDTAVQAGGDEPGFFAKHKVALIVAGVVAAGGGVAALVLAKK